MIEIAKTKDNGTMAKIGMKFYCSKFFGINNIYAESVNYIVDTYLECIDNISFIDWINGRYERRPVILKEKDLKFLFKDLMDCSQNLEMITDLFMYLYNQEFWVDYNNECIYCTEYTLKDNRTKLNFTGIAMEFERLCVLHEKELLEWSDIDSMVYCLSAYGYDIAKDYDYRTNDLYETAENIEERLNQIFEFGL